jgi:hypothetical protein
MVVQVVQVHYTGVILKDFSPEGSRVHRHDHRGVHTRCAPDPSQAQDDAIMGKGRP